MLQLLKVYNNFGYLSNFYPPICVCTCVLMPDACPLRPKHATLFPPTATIQCCVWRNVYSYT